MSSLPETTMIDIKDTISMFDRVGDGKIAVSDIVNALRSLDLNPASEDWKEEIDDFQRQNVLRIDVEQFATIYAEEKHKKEPPKERLIEGLKALDPVGGEIGLVNRAVLVRYLTVLGDKINESDMDTLLKGTLDKEGKNVVISSIIERVTNPVD